MNRKKSNEVPQGNLAKSTQIHGNPRGTQVHRNPMKFFGVPLQNGREFTEIERNPKGVRTYTFQSECKSMHLIVATRMVAHTQKKNQ
jgi:hypothetical protein